MNFFHTINPEFVDRQSSTDLKRKDSYYAMGNALIYYKIVFREALTALRWRLRRDYDKCFWDEVRKIRAHPNISLNPSILDDLTLGHEPPYFLSNEPDRIRKWIEIARTRYSEDPVTQVIVGTLLSYCCFLIGDRELESKRMSLFPDIFGDGLN